MNEIFISIKGNLDILKDFVKKNYRKIALNGRTSLIENFMENLETDLKTFETCVLCRNKAEI